MKPPHEGEAGACGLWNGVEYGDADCQEDRIALDAILSAILANMIRTLAVKKTSKEALEAIRAIHIGTDRTMQPLRREWDWSCCPSALAGA